MSQIDTNKLIYDKLVSLEMVVRSLEQKVHVIDKSNATLNLKWGILTGGVSIVISITVAWFSKR